MEQNERRVDGSIPQRLMHATFASNHNIVNWTRSAEKAARSVTTFTRGGHCRPRALTFEFRAIIFPPQ